MWFLLHGLRTVVPPLGGETRCDVAVIGSGITGALVAWTLASEGASVVVLDRRDLAQGSTMASTALLQYDLDVPLHRLMGMLGPEAAVRAYELGVEAVGTLERVGRKVGSRVERRPSLYFVREGGGLAELEEELECREEAGFDVAWADRDELRERWGVNAAGAISSKRAAQCDPYELTHALLADAARRGVVVHDRTTVRSVAESSRGVRLKTDRGAVVHADVVVHATGYEAAAMLPRRARRVLELRSTYVMATEPLEKEPHGEACMLWEYADPYLYARRAGDRLLFGGGDVAFTNPARRDRLISGKARWLAKEFRAVLQGVEFETAFAWAGTFATTKDGLGFIGAAPGSSRQLYALGFGGNGITCSAIAARMIADQVAGRENGDAALFRVDRPAPRERGAEEPRGRLGTKAVE